MAQMTAAQRLIDKLNSQGSEPHNLVVLHRGEQVLAAQWAPYRVDRPALVHSISKTFTSLAIGCLVDDGLVDLGADASTYLKVSNPFGFTVKDILTMSTGHSSEQINAMPFDVDVYFSTQPENDRGSFAYSSPSTYVLSALIEQVTGGGIVDLIGPRILEPLGFGTIWWRERDGREQGYSGLHVTAQDLAKIGQLLLDEGRWHGRQLISAQYVTEMARAHVPTVPPEYQPGDGSVPDMGLEWTFGYGLQVWPCRRGFRLDGAFGQFVLVLPEDQLVLAYQGASDYAQLILDAFWEYADAFAIEGSPESPEEYELDSWANRDTLVSAGECTEVADWFVGAPADGAGWRIEVPSGPLCGVVPVGLNEWARSIFNGPANAQGAESTQYVVEARGETLDGGRLCIHLVFPTQQHMLILEAEAGAPPTGTWHTVPMRDGGIAALHSSTLLP